MYKIILAKFRQNHSATWVKILSTVNLWFCNILRFDVYPISSSIGKKSEFWIGGNIIPLLYVIYIYIRIFLGVFSMYSIMWYHMFVCVKMWYSQNPVLLFIILFLLVHGQHMVVKLPFSDTSLVSSHYPTRIPNKIPIVVAEKPSFFQDYPIILMWKFSCFLDKSSLSYGFPMVFTVFLWWTPPCFAGSSVWISV